MPNTKPPKPKKIKQSKAKTPVPRKHDLGNISCNNNNNISIKTISNNTESGKNSLNIVDSNRESSDSDNDSLYDDQPCPCKLSNTNSWKLKCTKCNQLWHSSCANLKGVSEEFITSLEHWLCPWCFAVPFPKPESYFSEAVIEADGSAIYNFSKEFQNLSKSITKTISESITNLESKILSNNPNQLEMNTSDNNPSPDSVLPNITNKHNESYIDEEKQNFLDAESCAKLIKYFDNCEFTQENGHSVVSFGEPYRYAGSKSKPSQIPEILNSVIDKIHDEFNLEGNLKITSCLVNQFSGKDSFLKEHSDDEMNIYPESSIFTVSLGDTGTVKFREVCSGSKFELKPASGSLYTMSRKSQNYFKHEICVDEQSNSVRYSLTFRAVHWRFWNSTSIGGN